jgi:SAM-dependent methyltransferase
MSAIVSWDPVWEKIFRENEWGKYPSESLIRFIARNFYSSDRREIRILEVGCGTGANLWFISREGFGAYGIDGSRVAIDKASERLKEEGLCAELHVGDIVELSPFQDNFFDAVIDVECIYSNNAVNARKIFSEINRVLKNNGLFYSRTFSDKTSVGEAADYISELEVLNASEGPLQGKGFIRLSNEKSIHDLYSPYFKIHSIDTLDYTESNRQMNVSEFIIISSKISM